MHTDRQTDKVSRIIYKWFITYSAVHFRMIHAHTVENVVSANRRPSIIPKPDLGCSGLRLWSLEEAEELEAFGQLKTEHGLLIRTFYLVAQCCEKKRLACETLSTSSKLNQYEQTDTINSILTQHILLLT